MPLGGYIVIAIVIFYCLSCVILFDLYRISKKYAVKS